MLEDIIIIWLKAKLIKIHVTTDLSPEDSKKIRILCHLTLEEENISFSPRKLLSQGSLEQEQQIIKLFYRDRRNKLVKIQRADWDR